MKKKYVKLLVLSLLSVLLLCTNVQASETGARSQEINSTGIFRSNGAEGESVYIDSVDLVNLANEVDSLEEAYKRYAEDEYDRGYADGYAARQPSTATITYKYHVHTGNSSSGGGCYTTPVYHQHSAYGGSCYTWAADGAGCKRGYHMGEYSHTMDSGDYKDLYHCEVCGCVDGWGNFCSHPGYKLTCSLGNSIVGYQLGCGKSTSTIESMTITYH